MLSALDWLRDQRDRFRASGLGMVIIVLLVASFVLGFCAREQAREKTSPGTPAIATITRIGFGSSKYDPYMRFVTAQDAQGIPATASVPAPLIFGCRIGDTIKAKRVGIMLVLEPAPCTPHAKQN